MALFDDDQRQAIALAIEKVELSTAGELAVVHTTRSDDYAVYRSVFAFVISLGLLDAAHIVWSDWQITLLLAAQAVAVVILYRAAAWGPLLRRLVPGRIREECTMQRATRAFIEEGVTETRDRSGVLIFLSEVERRVVILADSGINTRVEPDEWKNDTQLLVQALKAENAVAGLVDVIERIGVILAATFPPRDDDTNELPNAPREVV